MPMRKRASSTQSLQCLIHRARARHVRVRRVRIGRARRANRLPESRQKIRHLPSFPSFPSPRTGLAPTPRPSPSTSRSRLPGRPCQRSSTGACPIPYEHSTASPPSPHPTRRASHAPRTRPHRHTRTPGTQKRASSPPRPPGTTPDPEPTRTRRPPASQASTRSRNPDESPSATLPAPLGTPNRLQVHLPHKPAGLRHSLGAKASPIGTQRVLQHLELARRRTRRAGLQLAQRGKLGLASGNLLSHSNTPIK